MRDEWAQLRVTYIQYPPEIAFVERLFAAWRLERDAKVQLRKELAAELARFAEGDTRPVPQTYMTASPVQAERPRALTPCQHVNAIERALNELGVPQPGYPVPVANAVEILRTSLGAELLGSGRCSPRGTE
jgi:hypothetical protein